MNDVIQHLGQSHSGPFILRDRRVIVTLHQDQEFKYSGFVGETDVVGLWLQRDDAKVQFFPWTSIRDVILN